MVGQIENNGQVPFRIPNIKIAVKPTNEVLRKMVGNRDIQVHHLRNRLTHSDQWATQGVHLLSSFVSYPEGAPRSRRLVMAPNNLESAVLWQVTGPCEEEDVANAVYWTELVGRNPEMTGVRVLGIP